MSTIITKPTQIATCYNKDKLDYKYATNSTGNVEIKDGETDIDTIDTEVATSNLSSHNRCRPLNLATFLPNVRQATA